MTTPLAVVTGAASGIGLALTRELASRSIDIIAIDKDPMDFCGIPNVMTARIDVSDADAMQRLTLSFSNRPLNYLFSNAGIAAPGAVFSAARQDWQRAWDVNVMGHLNALQSCWPRLAASRGKAVVTVSAAALLSHPGAALYRASKAALLSMLESLYYESRDSGVTLHALCPGMVQSNILNNATPPDAQLPMDPAAAYLMEAMRNAEPAANFAKRVLDDLERSPPFYWFTHPETLAGIDARHRGVKDGSPPLGFGEMP